MVKNTVKWGLHYFHKSTSVFDKMISKKSGKYRWPPVFILGVPRSGTSLLNQLLIHSNGFSYFPNIANQFYMCPLSAMKFGLKFCPEYQSDFSSFYGFEKGCMAPSESGNIWNRWFPQEKRDGFNYTQSGYLSGQARSSIQELIADTESIFGLPYLTKNAKMSVRLPEVKNIFPDALFIQIKRNPFDSAVSILLRRRKFNLNWWSVMPEEYKDFKNDGEIDQVCQQVYFIEKNIERDIKPFSAAQRYALSYEDLCQGTTSELEKIEEFLTKAGLPLKRTGRKIPHSFDLSKPKIREFISEEELSEIREKLSKLYSNF
jgi:hypothetical protein